MRTRSLQPSRDVGAKDARQGRYDEISSAKGHSVSEGGFG
jgi:hypothetical protein